MPSDALSFFSGMAQGGPAAGIDMYKFKTQMGARDNARDQAYQAALARANADKGRAETDAAKLLFERESEFVPADQADAYFRAYGPKDARGNPTMSSQGRPVSWKLLDSLGRAASASAGAGGQQKYNPRDPWDIKKAVDDEVESLVKIGQITQNDAVKMRQDRYKAYAEDENRRRAQSGWLPMSTGYPGGDFVGVNDPRLFSPSTWGSGIDRYEYRNLPPGAEQQQDGFMLAPPPMGGPSPMQQRQGLGVQPTPRASNLLMPTPTPGYR